MNETDNARVTVYSYNKVWKTENRIYAIQNIILPVPIKPQELLYFFGAAAVVFILSALLPFIAMIPFILRYVALPYGATQFLLKKKLDGKMPLKYLYDYVIYLTGKGENIERFTKCSGSEKERIRVDWFCGTRRL